SRITPVESNRRKQIWVRRTRPRRRRARPKWTKWAKSKPNWMKPVQRNNRLRVAGRSNSLPPHTSRLATRRVWHPQVQIGGRGILLLEPLITTGPPGRATQPAGYLIADLIADLA